MPPANVSSHILSLVYFFLIWSPNLHQSLYGNYSILSSLLLPVSVYFPVLPNPFWEQEVTHEKWKSNAATLQIYTQWGSMFCSLLLLICLFLSVTENWDDAMVESSTTHTRLHSCLAIVFWESIIFYAKYALFPPSPKPLSCVHWKQGCILFLGYAIMLLSVLVSTSKNISPENITWMYPFLLDSLCGLRRPASIY